MKTIVAALLLALTTTMGVVGAERSPGQIVAGAPATIGAADKPTKGPGLEASAQRPGYLRWHFSGLAVARPPSTARPLASSVAQTRLSRCRIA